MFNSGEFWIDKEYSSELVSADHGAGDSLYHQFAVVLLMPCLVQCRVMNSGRVKQD
jgi:hypothetical protein